MAFINDIKRAYLQGSMLMRLILINIGAFVLLHVFALGSLLAGGQATSLLQWVELPSDLTWLIRRPWTLVTYMFSHYGLLHILFNMLWLYWLGSIFMEFFSPKQLTGLYLLGGWGGALFYLLAFNLLPHFQGTQGFLIGASASVIAIVVATAVYTPDYKIGLLFLGEVSIKWVAIVTVLIDVLGLDPGNLGGSMAHLGGAAVGAWFALRIKAGHDITRPLNAVIDSVLGLLSGRSIRMPEFRGKRRQSSARRDNGESRRTTSRPADTVSEEELDIILGKIKAAGYDALTDEEKDQLFKASRHRNA